MQITPENSVTEERLSLIEEIPTNVIFLKSATPFPKCYLHKEKWTFDS